MSECFSRLFDGVISTILGLAIILSPIEHPLIVARLLPETILEPSGLPFFIIVPFRMVSALSEIILRMYIYISITNIPNVLINTRTIFILIVSYVLVIFTGFIFVTYRIVFNFVVVSNAIALLFRAFFVPVNIIVSNANLSQIFVGNVQALKDSFKDFMTSTINRLSMSLTFLKNIIRSNQIAPESQDVESE